jgi:hypothetical protein
MKEIGKYLEPVGLYDFFFKEDELFVFDACVLVLQLMLDSQSSHSTSPVEASQESRTTPRAARGESRAWGPLVMQSRLSSRSTCRAQSIR